MVPHGAGSELSDWQEVRKALKAAGTDPNVIAPIGEAEGDSLDLVELTMAFEEAFECTGEICFSKPIGPDATAGG